MSLTTAHDQAAPAINDVTPSETRSVLLERAVAVDPSGGVNRDDRLVVPAGVGAVGRRVLAIVVTTAILIRVSRTAVPSG
jgi:hypothetical protein